MDSGKTVEIALFGGTMRTEEDIISRLEAKKAAQKHALENHLVWSLTNIGTEIKELIWVLGDNEK